MSEIVEGYKELRDELFRLRVKREKLDKKIRKQKKMIKAVIEKIAEWELVDYEGERGHPRQGKVIGTFESRTEGLFYAMSELGLEEGTMGDELSICQNLWTPPVNASDRATHRLQPSAKYLEKSKS